VSHRIRYAGGSIRAGSNHGAQQDWDMSYAPKKLPSGTLENLRKLIKDPAYAAIDPTRRVYTKWQMIRAGKINEHAAALIRRDHAKEFAEFDRQQAILDGQQA
jgi:hypothetical protein